jgi:hypothetical protein
MRHRQYGSVLTNNKRYKNPSRLPAAAAQPAQGSSEPVAPRIYFLFIFFIKIPLKWEISLYLGNTATMHMPLIQSYQLSGQVEKC